MCLFFRNLFIPERAYFAVARGFLSFVVASAFLLVLVSSAVKLSERAPDVAYEPVVAMHLQEQAISAAFSDALSDAAGKALVVSQASGAEAPAAVRAAVYLSALDFERQLREQGYDAAFWCGKASEAALQGASASMASEGKAIIPEGTRPISDATCLASFDANLFRKKVLLREVGFSLYSKEAGMGHALLLPEGFEGEING